MKQTYETDDDFHLTETDKSKGDESDTGSLGSIQKDLGGALDGI
jgi:hypothetical protein